MRPALSTLLAGALACTVAAAAGDAWADGIAFAQTPEGTWWCRGADGARTAACALDKCRAESDGEECVATRWCYPAGWSGLMVAWLPEFRATHVICGAPSDAAVGAALEATCGAADEYTRCDFVLLIDPSGREREIRDTTWPGPAVMDTD